MTTPAFPTNAQRCRVRFFWWGQDGGGSGKKTTFRPTETDLTDMSAFGYIETESKMVLPDATSALVYADLICTDDPDLTPFLWEVTREGKQPQLIQVSVSNQVVDVGGGLMMRAMWLTDAATTEPPPDTPDTFYNSSATDAAIVNGVSVHNTASDAHPDIRAALEDATGAVSSVAGRTGDVTLTKADVGLNNVNNTADANKPVSTSQQAALDAVVAAVPEQARDAVGAALVGSGITVTVNDAADTITLTATGGGAYTDEQAQDAFAALVAAGTHSGISFVYNDAGNAISATVTAQSWSQITGKPTFSTVATSGSYTDLTGKPTIPAAFADLTGSVPSSALPALAINDTFTVADQAAMLALTAQRGDIAIRQDRITAQQPAVYILGADDATTLANWINLPVPADAVASVAGRTGIITLGKADVGLGNVDNTADTAKPTSTATQTALDGKQAADSDLTAIAALDATTAGAIASDGSGWIKKTYAQLKAALGIGVTDLTATGTRDGTTYLRGDNTWATPAGGSGAVSSVNSQTGAVTLAAADVGATRVTVDGTYASTYALDTTPVAAADIGAQPVSTALTGISGLTPTNDDVLQRKAGAWANRTLTQLATDLGLAPVAKSGSAADLTTGTLPVERLPAVSTAQLYKNANQAFTAQGAVQALTLPSVNYSRGVAVSTPSSSTNPSATNSLKALVAGVYLIGSAMQASAAVNFQIAVNGTTVHEFSLAASGRTASSITYPLAANDVITMTIFTSVSVTVQGTTAKDCNLTLTQLGS